MKIEIICAVCFSVFLSIHAYSQIALPEKVNTNLAQFKKNGEADALLEAIHELANHQVNELSDRVKLQLTLLAGSCSAFDPNYDTNPPPPIQVHVMPPMGYDSGVSPDTIKDQTQKKVYEKRIAENTQCAKQHQIQRAIRDLISDIGNSMVRLDPSIQKEVESSPLIQELPASVKALVMSASEEKRKKEANKTLHPTEGAVVPK